MRLLFAITTLLLFSCAPEIKIYTDHDPDYQIESFSTFDWGQKINIEQNRNPLHYNELNDKRIKKAVADQLTSRGYKYADQDPELLIHYHMILDDQSVVVPEPYGYFYGPYWLRSQTNVYAYREGTLIVDLMDVRTNSLLWRGWAVSALDMVYTPSQTEELISRAIEKIFRNFPNRNEGKTVVRSDK